MLRRENFAGSIVMLSSDAAAPVDCPSLSKDYLAPATPQRTACRTGRHHSTQKAPSTCESRRRLFAFIPVRGKSRPQVDRVFGMIDCCLLPGLSRFVTGSPGATRRTFISSFACGLPCHHRTRTNARRAIIPEPADAIPMPSTRDTEIIVLLVLMGVTPISG